MTEKRSRITWLSRLWEAQKAPDFDLKKFAGSLAHERTAAAVKAIKAIGSPFVNSEADLPKSDKLAKAIHAELLTASQKLMDELKNGKRTTATKSTGCYEI